MLCHIHPHLQNLFFLFHIVVDQINHAQNPQKYNHCPDTALEHDLTAAPEQNILEIEYGRRSDQKQQRNEHPVDFDLMAFLPFTDPQYQNTEHNPADIQCQYADHPNVCILCSDAEQQYNPGATQFLQYLKTAKHQKCPPDGNSSYCPQKQCQNAAFEYKNLSCRNTCFTQASEKDIHPHRSTQIDQAFFSLYHFRLQTSGRHITYQKHFQNHDQILCNCKTGHLHPLSIYSLIFCMISLLCPLPTLIKSPLSIVSIPFSRRST